MCRQEDEDEEDERDDDDDDEDATNSNCCCSTRTFIFGGSIKITPQREMSRFVFERCMSLKMYICRLTFVVLPIALSMLCMCVHVMSVRELKGSRVGVDTHTKPLQSFPSSFCVVVGQGCQIWHQVKFHLFLFILNCTSWKEGKCNSRKRSGDEISRRSYIMLADRRGTFSTY